MGKSTYTPEKGEAICARLAEGESLLSICTELGIPHSTARKWEAEIPEHGANSTRAREIGCHVLADQCVKIADEDQRDWEPVKDADGNIVGVKVNGEHVQRSKLRIETRMRLIGKWLPKVYGDKTTLSNDPDAPFAALPDAQLLNRIAALQAKLNAGTGGT